MFAHTRRKGFGLIAVAVFFALSGPALGTGEIGSYIDALADDARRDVAQDRLMDCRQEAVAPLRKALSHPNAKVRMGAATVLGRLRAKEAAGDLAGALSGDDRRARVAAAIALAEIADPGTLPTIAQAARHEDAATRAACAFAMGHLKDERALDALMALADDDAGEVRSQVAAALGVLGDKRAAPVLTWMVTEDDDPEVRALAAGALADVGEPGAAHALVGALADPETVVQSYAVRSLRILTSRNFSFSPHAPVAQKAEARRQWQAHVAANKKTLATIQPARPAPVAPAERPATPTAISGAPAEAVTPEQTPSDGATRATDESAAASTPFEANDPAFAKAEALDAYRKAARAHERNDLAAAFDGYTRAIELDNDLAEAHAGLAACLLRSGLADAAIEPLSRAIALRPRKALYHARLAEALGRSGRPGDALAAARKAFALAGDGQDATVPYVRRVALSNALASGDLAFAADVVDALEGNAPPDMQSLVGRFLYQAGVERSALATLEAAREQNLLTEEGLVTLAKCLLAAPEKAEGIDLALRLRRASLVAPGECAALLLRAGASAEAAAVLLETFDEPAARSQAGAQPLEPLIAQQVAREKLRSAQELDAAGCPARALALKGEALASAGRTDDARQAWEKALALDPLNETAIAGLAREALARDDAGRAVALVTTALARAPRKNARLQALWAQALARWGDDHQAAQVAEEALREALDADALYELAAQAWADAGRTKKAHALLRRYVAQRPGDRSFAALARFLATTEDAALRRGDEARYYAELAAGGRDPIALREAAAALRAVGEEGAAQQLEERAATLERPLTLDAALGNAAP